MPISYLYFMMDFNQLSKMLFLNIWLRSDFQEMGVLMSGEEKEAIMAWGNCGMRGLERRPNLGAMNY